jgi:hypothetical protein
VVQTLTLVIRIPIGGDEMRKRRKFALMIGIMIFLQTIYSCGYIGSQPVSNNIDIPTKSATTSETHVPTAGNGIQNKESGQKAYIDAILQCSLYLESQWGSDLSEFGFITYTTTGKDFIRGPYSPTFDEMANMYIADPVNQRVLQYPVGSIIPRAIKIPESYILDNYSNYRFWSNVSVSNGKLFLVFNKIRNDRLIQQLAVLSMDGREEQINDLEPYYPLMSVSSSPVMSDKHGGVYLDLTPIGIVHFDDLFRPEIIQDRDGNIFENLAIGWDGNLYSYEFTNDLLNNWGQSNQTLLIAKGEPLSSITNIISTTLDKSPSFGRIIGADSKGRLILSYRTNENILRIIRISEEKWELATVLSEGTRDLFPLSLSPDGSLFGIIYNSSDQTIKPRIVKCMIQSNLNYSLPVKG